MVRPVILYACETLADIEGRWEVKTGIVGKNKFQTNVLYGPKGNDQIAFKN